VYFRMWKTIKSDRSPLIRIKAKDLWVLSRRKSRRGGGWGAHSLFPQVLTHKFKAIRGKCFPTDSIFTAQKLFIVLPRCSTGHSLHIITC
jgi:hypothetical protein